MTMNITKTSTEMLLEDLQNEFGGEEIRPLLIASEKWNERHPGASASEWAKAMTLESLSNLDEATTYWTFVAARIHFVMFTIVKNSYAVQRSIRILQIMLPVLSSKDYIHPY